MPETWTLVQSLFSLWLSAGQRSQESIAEDPGWLKSKI